MNASAAEESVIQSLGKANRQPADRWRLWIDGCGGYGLFGGKSWTVGGAIPDNDADIRVRSDMPRLAGQLTRNGEDYFWQPPDSAHRDLLISGKALPIDSSARLVFRRPSTLSTTAVVQLKSAHRFDDHIDHCLLCGDTVLIGPTADNHIVTSNFPDRVVLVFRDGVWKSKRETDGPLETLDLNCRVQLQSLAMTLEKA